MKKAVLRGLRMIVIVFIIVSYVMLSANQSQANISPLCQAADMIHMLKAAGAK